ncbi:DEAD/DEAH box helicase family protein [Hydrogenimonas thermophila]|uniref:DEAD/DEAH box helicase family protein n=1 Tax=Hydrogenimonas thermophila TaxID=223786 RepID=UPI002936EE66|nr:DEAD/DEAH box helicase family protein [Hydrogenimonas thermophila]WOE68899.1 DEAD/DEAH box helicase family protein [Hydrogenimonas thermophila]WOE71407.1 DEAD/DEAH box helicase family protein [Hydrogenimonas thermophila]
MSEEEQKQIARLKEELEYIKNKYKKLKKECEPVLLKKKHSNKKQIEDYLFLYNFFLNIFGVMDWSELKNLYKRDEHRKICIELEGKNLNIFSEDQEDKIQNIVERVNSYENQLKTRYKNEQFEYTDYQVFAVLFSEYFLTFKDEIIEYLKENLPKNAKEICIVDNKFDIDDDKKVAELFGMLTKEGKVNANFLKKIDKEKKKIVTKERYLQEINKLAYYMATGSGKTVLLHTNILQSFEHFKGANFYVVVPTKELGKQHKKNLINFGLKESEIGFIDDDKSENISEKVNNMLISPYEIKIITVHQLSAINKRKTIFSGVNVIFVDEGHKGGSNEEGWRQDRNKLIGENGFAYEYSATFSHAIKEDIELLQEYAKSIIFDYPYHKFYNDGYGKKPIFEPKEKLDNIYKSIYDKKEKLYDFSDDERYQLFIKDILNFYYQKQLFYNLDKNEKEKFHFENPLKLIICSTVDDKNNNSKVVEVLKNLKRFSTQLEETKKYIEKIEENKKLKTSLEEIFLKVFNSKKVGKILEYKLNDKEVGLKVEDSKDYFGVVNVGNVNNLGRDLIEDKITGSLINDFFTKGDNEKINIVIAARILIEGWDTQRISSLSLFDFGKSKGSLIVQLFGRGVRLHGSKENNLKRSGVYEKLEEFSIYGYDAEYLKTFIEESELENIIKQKSISIKLSEIKKDKLQNLRIIKPKNDFENQILIYQFNEEQFNTLIRKLRYDWVNNTNNSFELNIKLFINIRKLYKDTLLKQKENVLIPFDQFEKTVMKILENDIKVKKTIHTNSFEIFYKIALKMVNSYFDYWYKLERKAYEFENVEYKEIDEKDKNLDFVYTVTADETIIDDLTQELNRNSGIYEVNLSKFSEIMKFNDRDFAIKNNEHLYNPLLIKHNELQISPDRLEESEVIFLKKLNSYKEENKKNIILLRNQKHIGFNGFYPDFIMWYKKDDIEHFIFLDPKGINNFNVDEVWDKISFSFEIKKIEKKLNNPNLRLHSFILPTKSLKELSTKPEIKNTLNFHITKKFGNKLVELSEEQIQEALKILNLICVSDDHLIEQIIEEIKYNDVEQISKFIQDYLLENDATVKLDNYIKNFTEKDITKICKYAKRKEDAIIAFIYKEIFKNEDIFKEFCDSLKQKELNSIKKDIKEMTASEILTEVGLELLMDSIPYLKVGLKTVKYIGQKSL